MPRRATSPAGYVCEAVARTYPHGKKVAIAIAKDHIQIGSLAVVCDRSCPRHKALQTCTNDELEATALDALLSGHLALTVEDAVAQLGLLQEIGVSWHEGEGKAILASRLPANARE